MSAHDDDLRLDGNAIAGLLRELFGAEATIVVRTCEACGARAELGAHHLYGRGPALVLRCPGCEGVALRIAELPGRTLVEISNTVRLDRPES